MSALAAILAARGFRVSGSDPRRTAVVEKLETCGVRIFSQQEAATITSLLSEEGVEQPLVVISSAVPESNAELQEARRQGLPVAHRSDVLAALINDQPSIAVPAAMTAGGAFLEGVKAAARA